MKQDYFKQLPTWAKGVIAVGILGITGIVLYKGYSWISGMIEKQRQGTALQDTQKELDKLSAAGQVPSYPDIQYELWANAMEECYQGWGTCTGDTIFVNLHNDADMVKLIKAFGVRTIKSGRLNVAPDLTGDLAKVVRDELDETEIGYVNNVLEKNGITYRF